MNSKLLPVLLAVAAVVVIGLLMRRAAGEAPPVVDDRSPEEGEAPDRDDELGEQLDDFAEEDHEAVAVTSDGHSFMPDAHAVRIVPPAEGDEGAPWSRSSDEAGRGRNRRGEAAIGLSLHAGDLSGARVTRGGADEDPWRLETMGRDGDYACWGFETREAAEAAGKLLELRGIVRTGTDEEERPMPPSAEAWREARRAWEQTQAELALDFDDDEPGDRRTD